MKTSQTIAIISISVTIVGIVIGVSTLGLGGPSINQSPVINVNINNENNLNENNKDTDEKISIPESTLQSEITQESKPENTNNFEPIDELNTPTQEPESKSTPIAGDITQFKHIMTIPDPGISASKSAPGMFNMPLDVAVDSNGNFYVTDFHNTRVQKFDPQGNVIASWGGAGDGPGQFRGIGGISIDDNDMIYVGEYQGTRIQVFDSDGKYQKSFPPEQILNDKPYTLRHPYNVAIDSNDQIYITDRSNNRIVKLDSNGQFIKSWGTPGSGITEFRNPTGIVIDEQDYVYVSDAANNRIMKFDTNGTFLETWGAQGYGPNQFTSPQGIALDDDNNIFVAEYTGHRVSIIKTDGTWVGTISSFAERGTKPGHFIQPWGVAVHGDMVYVTERDNNRVQAFTKSMENP